MSYIDPPFNSNRNYEVFWGDTQEKRAFEDRFGDVEAYITYMRPRVVEMYRVLKKSGSFYYHCDWHASPRRCGWGTGKGIDKENGFGKIKVLILGEGLPFLAEIGLPKGRIAKRTHKTPHLRAFYVVRS